MAQNSPNLIILTLHDAGQHFGCYGVETVRTPAIDGLAADGCKFTRMFTAGSPCSPSRGCMMTGRYPQSNGIIGLVHTPWSWSLNEGERHMAAILRDAGYHTGLFCLQHETTRTVGPGPKSLGFDELYTVKDGVDKNLPAPETSRLLADFLKGAAREKQPFYIQVGFFESHRQFNFGGAKPDDEKGVYVPPWLVDNEGSRRELAEMQGALRQADEGVGIILKALAESGLEENTIFVFTVDHGIPFPRAKGSLYDAGLEIGFIVRWPGGGIRGGKTCDWMLSNVDCLPTLLELLGVNAPANVEGKSFAGAFRDDGTGPPRDEIFAEFQSPGNITRCCRTERYKLIRSFEACRRLDVPVDITQPVRRETCPVAELFDLEKDPNEFTDVAADPAYAEALAEMDARLRRWMEEVNDPLLSGPVATPYYEEAMAAYRKRERVI